MTLKIETFNDQSKGEEIFNSISHGLGVLFAVAGTVLLIIRACYMGSAIDIVSFSIYGFSLIELYTMSCVYHAITNIRAKKVMQVMDHCSVFILILGTYTPICLSLLGGKIGWILFLVNAFFTILGITLNAISVSKWHKLSLICYLAMGWSIIAAIKPLLSVINFQGFMLLLLGGILYSIGVLFYRAAKPPYMHGVWHLFVLAGSIFHYFFIYFFIL
ncbi:PAQR family membrane homeostasis protein TrhA [Anaerovorax odorimutans]|uniref:PAQR family membrane homeostasis protein TrhA n=1 Tax=Anaerovorax odorimutans TaxID=109327 RepID=UPI000414C7BD|nr:hemolysin III family protein [Anaerovorax odorimutans]